MLQLFLIYYIGPLNTPWFWFLNKARGPVIFGKYENIDFFLIFSYNLFF